MLESQSGYTSRTIFISKVIKSRLFLGFSLYTQFLVFGTGFQYLQTLVHQIKERFTSKINFGPTNIAKIGPRYQVVCATHVPGK